MTICYKYLIIYNEMSLLNFFNLKQKPKNLHDYMEINKLSRKELAGILGITESYLSYILNGKRKLGKSKAIKASSITGIPLENLIQ